MRDGDIDPGVQARYRCGVLICDQRQPGCQPLPVTAEQFSKDRLLVRKVLVERANTDPRLFSDVIGREVGLAGLVENVSCGVQNRFRCGARPGLARGFSGQIGHEDVVLMNASRKYE